MKKYYRRILFTKTPLKSQFRYKDKFQILPIDSEKAPTSEFNKHFPIFLEYYLDNDEPNPYKDVDTFLNDLSNQQIAEFEIMNVLSVLTNHRFFKYKLDNNQWGIMHPPVKFKNLTQEQKDSFKNQYSSWIFSGYLYPGLKEDLEIVEFTNLKFPEPTLVSPYYKYFTNDPIENEKGEITFPETINSCLDNYYKLSKKTSRKVKSSISLICDGMDIKNYKRSLAFLSFVSAIESFVGLEYNDKEIEFSCKSCHSISKSPYSCPECKNPIWGIKTKFKEFLKTFVSGTKESITKYNKIYNIRSKITHQGQLFIDDYELTLNNMDKKESDLLTGLETLQLARLSLTNWLRYENKASTQQW